MGMHTIPASYDYYCDVCKTAKKQETQSRPKYWSEMKVERDAYDYQGCAVANGGFALLICDECSKEIYNHINDLQAKKATLAEQVERGNRG